MGARAQGAQMLPQFRPEERGKAGVSLPLAWAPAFPRALSRLCRPVPGALPRARPRGPNGNHASPRELVRLHPARSPPLIPTGHATRVGEEAGRPRNPEAT